jgi:hypothetical protein
MLESIELFSTFLRSNNFFVSKIDQVFADSVRKLIMNRPGLFAEALQILRGQLYDG